MNSELENLWPLPYFGKGLRGEYQWPMGTSRKAQRQVRVIMSSLDSTQLNTVFCRNTPCFLGRTLQSMRG